MELWTRAVEVVFGATQVTGLRCAFKATKSLKPEPNTAELQIWNLSPDTRAKMQQTMPVSISAGYAGGIARIFLGDMRSPWHERQGCDLITSLRAGDGENAVRTARVNESISSGAGVGQAFEKLINKIGISADDALKKIKSGELRGSVKEFFKGFTASGGAWDEFQRLLDGTGFEGSIQDGVVQLLERGQPTNDQDILLTSDSGLIGSPELVEKKKKNEKMTSIVRARSLLQPGLFPGRAVKIESTAIDGRYRIESVTHTGDTHGTDWYSDIEVTQL